MKSKMSRNFTLSRRFETFFGAFFCTKQSEQINNFLYNLFIFKFIFRVFKCIDQRNAYNTLTVILRTIHGGFVILVMTEWTLWAWMGLKFPNLWLLRPFENFTPVFFRKKIYNVQNLPKMVKYAITFDTWYFY